MVFSSMMFLFLFLPVVLCVYFLFLKKLQYRNVFLLIASLLFYAWGEPVYVLLMILSIIINFKLAYILDGTDKDNTTQRKALMAVGIVANLFFLFVFKYESFIVDTLTDVLPMRMSSFNLALPIGISFFTFQALSYLVDVYRGTAPLQTSIVNLGLYVSFFPQLIAGPIVRYNTIAAEISDRSVNPEDLGEGVRRFIIGLGKKMLLSNQFSLIAEASFGHELPSFSFAWLGAIAYTLQIYYDFSGYSDMAIGLGRIFGFHFLENFNYPYISKTVSEFWRRWHMSLGTWFRDYLYIPLGGSRVNKKRLVFNLFVVWLCTGVWHGAAWQFLVWGLLYFVALTFEKLTNMDSLLKKSHIASFLYRCLTLVLIVFGWVIFGEKSLTGGLMHLKIMIDVRYIDFKVSLDTLEYWDMYYRFIILGILLATPLVPAILKKVHTKLSSKLAVSWDVLATIGYMLMFLTCVSYLTMGVHNPFIYFNF